VRFRNNKGIGTVLRNLENIRMRITEKREDACSELFEIKLPDMLAILYGGNIELLYDPKPADIPLLFASFVMSREGIFALRDTPGPSSISQGSVSDAFLMALLLSVTDAVMVGANTLNSEPHHKWHAKHIFETFPHMKEFCEIQKDLEELRKTLGKKDSCPPTFFMTNSGNVNPNAAVFSDPTIKTYIVTSEEGAKTAKKLFQENSGVEILSFGRETLDELAMLRHLKTMGVSLVYHQGGRTVFASMVEKGLIPQIFLTVVNKSPKGNLSPENTQFLFSTDDHQPPKDAIPISVRVAEEGEVMFANLDFSRVRLM
jgi:riboflavin biosynthesis pyrimidine reductase